MGHISIASAHLERLPLDLPGGADRLGLDEEGPRVDQLDALQGLSRRRVQVLARRHLRLAVARQLQDGLREGDGRGAGGWHLRDIQARGGRLSRCCIWYKMNWTIFALLIMAKTKFDYCYFFSPLQQLNSNI